MSAVSGAQGGLGTSSIMMRSDEGQSQSFCAEDDKNMKSQVSLNADEQLSNIGRALVEEEDSSFCPQVQADTRNDF